MLEELAWLRDRWNSERPVPDPNPRDTGNQPITTLMKVSLITQNCAIYFERVNPGKKPNFKYIHCEW